MPKDDLDITQNHEADRVIMGGSGEIALSDGSIIKCETIVVTEELSKGERVAVPSGIIETTWQTD